MLSHTLLGAAALALTASGASAQGLALLTGPATIEIADATSGKVARAMTLTGMAAPVLGIDVRPADGRLYALAEDGGVYTIDLATGAATMKSKLDKMLPAGTAAIVDFNPAADRLRVMGEDGTNLRANVDDGKVTTDGALKFAEGTAKPRVVAGAYTNSVKGAKETALFDIDASGTFLKQAPPNDGVLVRIGEVGASSASYAFDILRGPDGDRGYLVAGRMLYGVDLATGKATPTVMLEGSGPVRDVAVLPAN